MYKYSEVDQQLVEQRVAQFRDQTQRFLDGSLNEDEFRVLGLQNGLYIQRHAPMLRVAIPYGMLVSKQLRTLAYIARRWDKGYVHFSIRQNIQFNWPRLEDVPDILAKLATVQMYAIQTSGNRIRSTTTDNFAGVAADEIINPLIWCEIIRQWSMSHPEFAFLPQKFKIAISGAASNRIAVSVHDIRLQAVKVNQELGFRVWVGGGLGRTPIIGKLINPFVAWDDLFTYLQAILHVYNLHGCGDDKYKARIKTLVKDLSSEVFAQQVNEQWQLVKSGSDKVTHEQVAEITNRFDWPTYDPSLASQDSIEGCKEPPKFDRWLRTNAHPHKVKGYASVTVLLKANRVPSGDITADEMEALVDISEKYSFGKLGVSHEQNLILADVEKRNLHRLWQELDLLNLAIPNIELITNIISCSGGDYCSLANAASTPVAVAIGRHGFFLCARSNLPTVLS